MATGNGAYILHKKIESEFHHYHVRGYNPYFTLLPFILPVFGPTKDVDILHSTPDYAFFFMRRSIPSVLTFHNYVLDPWMKPFSTWLQQLHYKTDLKFFIRLAVERASALTAVSKYTADIAKNDLNIKKKIKVIYNGVDSDLFAPKVKKPNKKTHVFFSGNLSLRKGVQWLPSIAKKLNKDIVIYYTSGLKDRNVIPNAPSNLIPVGSVPYKEMPGFYNSMDILLMPTVREGFSLSVLEAMACGLPVIASDCSSLPEQIVNKKGGYLCPVGDANAFAEKINELASRKPLIKEMGQFNRTRIEDNFTIKQMISEYNEFFKI